MFPNFVGEGNNAPKFGFAGTMAYQALKGLLRIDSTCVCVCVCVCVCERERERESIQDTGRRKFLFGGRIGG